MGNDDGRENMGVYVAAAMASVGSIGISLSHATDSIHAEDLTW